MSAPLPRSVLLALRPCKLLCTRSYAALIRGRASADSDIGIKMSTSSEVRKRAALSGFASIASFGPDTAANDPQHSIPDATFEVLNAGSPGAMVSIRVPPRSEIYAVPGTAVAVSGKVRATRSTDGNILIAVGRKFAGGALMFHKFTTDAHPGNVLLAPVSSLSDITVIRMDGRSEYYIRKGAFLAKGPRVALSTGTAHGMGVLKVFALKASGVGTVAISGCSGMQRLVLQSGEEYWVNPRHLIAWDAMTYPKVTAPLVQRSANPPRRGWLPRLSKPPLPRRMRNFLETLRTSPSVQPTLDRLRRNLTRTRKWFLGGPELLKLTGPGDFYVASRVEPVLGGFKFLTPPTVEEIEDVHEVPFPPSETHSQGLAIPPKISYATVERDGRVTFSEPSLSKRPNVSNVLGVAVEQTGLIASLYKLRRSVFGDRASGNRFFKRE